MDVLVAIFIKHVNQRRSTFLFWAMLYVRPRLTITCMEGAHDFYFFFMNKKIVGPLQWGAWQPKLSVVQLAKFFFFNGLWALMNITCIARVKVGPKFFFFLVELIRKKINPHKFFYIIKKKNARKKWRLTKP